MDDRLANSQDVLSQTQRNERMRGGRKSPVNEKAARGPARSAKKKKNFPWLFPILLMTMGCGVFLFAAWSAVNSPALASILSLPSTAQEANRPPSFAQVQIAKPAHTPAAPPATAQAQAAVTPTPTPSPAPSEPPEPEPTLAPAEPPPSDPEAVAAETETVEAYVESVAIAEIVPDTPTPAYVPPSAAPNSPPPLKMGSGERWIDVDLSEQRLYAYEGDTLIRSFVVSTGTWRTPTVTGKFKIWIKLRSSSMSGPGYYLPDVPYVMYFYKGYGIHGTYWHNNFGTPMSRGCVNMTIADAEWVYNFVSVGTVVNVHP